MPVTFEQCTAMVLKEVSLRKKCRDVVLMKFDVRSKQAQEAFAVTPVAFHTMRERMKVQATLHSVRAVLVDPFLDKVSVVYVPVSYSASQIRNHSNPGMNIIWLTADLETIRTVLSLDLLETVHSTKLKVHHGDPSPLSIDAVEIIQIGPQSDESILPPQYKT